MTDLNPSPGNARPLVADVQDIHRQAASMFLCWPTNAIDLAKKDSDLPIIVAKLAQLIANWEAKGAYLAQDALTAVPAQAMPQQVQEACAQVADRAAERYAEGKVMPGDHIRHMLALGIARSIRSLIPPASQLPSTMQKSPVMQAAEEAQKVVATWSDSKKDYADRITGVVVTSPKSGGSI